MKKFNVKLYGMLEFKNIEANDEDDAYVKAMEMAEEWMVHDIIDDGEVEEVK